MFEPMRHRTFTTLALLLASLAVDAAPPEQSTKAAIPGGKFESVLPPAAGVKEVEVKPFQLDRRPVTNAQFAAFVKNQPQWRREKIARLFADDQYLSHWQSASQPHSEDLQRPVVHVSWFAATAYCESLGARLPTWYEWEYVAAASDKARDGRDDPAWRQQILNWYSRSARDALPTVGSMPANFYGIQDLHGVIWEWVEDAGGMLVSADNREQGDPNSMRFCGEGALTMEQKENYATLMRIAMLSSMKARYTGAAMGFRCASGGREGT